MIFCLELTTQTTSNFSYPISGTIALQLGAIATQTPRSALFLTIPGTFSHLSLRSSVIVAGATMTYTISINGVDSLLAVTIVTGSNSAIDLIHTVHANAGDWISIHFVPGTGNPVWITQFTTVFTPD
jgi:hypothetical protein